MKPTMMPSTLKSNLKDSGVLVTMLQAFFRKKLMDMMKTTKMSLPKLTLIAGLLAASLSTTAFSADQKLNSIAAVVNNEVVLIEDVQRAAQRARAGGNQDDARTLFQKSLDNLILERLQVQEAKRLGINPNTAQVNNAIAEVAQRNNLSVNQLAQELAKEGMTMELYRQTVADQMRLGTLKRRQSQQQTEVLEQDVTDLISAESKQVSQGMSYRIQDILIPAPQPLSSANFTQASKSAAQLRLAALKNKDFLSVKSGASTATDLGWKEASELSFAYLKELNKLEVGQVSDVIQDARGFHVLKLIDKKGATASKAYNVHVRHILIAKNEANAQSKANSILQQIKNGGDFATLAKIHSADKGSAVNGGDLGWSDTGKYVPAFARASETLPLKTLSAPIQTEFGYHILEVLDRREVNNNQKLLEDRARKALQARTQNTDYNTWVQNLRTNAFIDYRVKP
ncbi:hypothetical protein EOL70_01345 [Leucothrix sargassi]|nr:hypothetical protein EOL70_01345 [Leucothrix sargassi]